MNINALIAFRAVANEGAVTVAARHLNRSVPAVSRQISQLEHELKLLLFHRANRRLVLTADGRAFLRETERLLVALDGLPQIASEIRSQRHNELSVVAMPRTLAGWVAPALAHVQRLQPKLRVSVDVQRRHDMENWLAGRHYDLGVAALPAQHAAIDVQEIIRAPMGVLVSRDHALASLDKVNAAQIVRHPLIGLSRGLLPREQMDVVFRGLARRPGYVLETTSTFLACQLVAQGAGIVVLDALSVTASLPEGCFIPVDPPDWVSFGLLTPKNVSGHPAVLSFADALRVIAQGLSWNGLRL